jgi:hypothetical protein
MCTSLLFFLSLIAMADDGGEVGLASNEISYYDVICDILSKAEAAEGIGAFDAPTARLLS